MGGSTTFHWYWLPLHAPTGPLSIVQVLKCLHLLQCCFVSRIQVPEPLAWRPRIWPWLDDAAAFSAVPAPLSPTLWHRASFDTAFVEFDLDLLRRNLQCDEFALFLLPLLSPLLRVTTKIPHCINNLWVILSQQLCQLGFDALVVDKGPSFLLRDDQFVFQEFLSQKPKSTNWHVCS